MLIGEENYIVNSPARYAQTSSKSHFYQKVKVASFLKKQPIDTIDLERCEIFSNYTP